MTIGVGVAKLLAQTLKSRGKGSLIGRGLCAIVFFLCVVGHAFDTRDGSGKITIVPPPKAARTILTGSIRVKNCTAAVNG